jgi:hypothetical protein
MNRAIEEIKMDRPRGVMRGTCVMARRRSGVAWLPSRVERRHGKGVKRISLERGTLPWIG